MVLHYQPCKDHQNQQTEQHHVNNQWNCFLCWLNEHSNVKEHHLPTKVVKVLKILQNILFQVLPPRFNLFVERLGWKIQKYQHEHEKSKKYVRLKRMICWKALKSVLNSEWSWKQIKVSQHKKVFIVQVNDSAINETGYGLESTENSVRHGELDFEIVQDDEKNEGEYENGLEESENTLKWCLFLNKWHYMKCNRSSKDNCSNRLTELKYWFQYKWCNQSKFDRCKKHNWGGTLIFILMKTFKVFVLLTLWFQ